MPSRFPVCLAGLGQGQRGRHHVGHVHDAPLAAQPLAVGAAVPARPAVVHVDDPDAAAGEEGLLQVEPGHDMGRGAAVHPDDVRRPLSVRAPDRGVGRRVDQRVHDRAGRPGQAGCPGHREVGGVWQRVRAAVELAGRRGPQVTADSGNVHADHGHRHRRAAGDGGDRLAGRGQPGAEDAVRHVEVGELARSRVEHAQPGLFRAVRDGDAAVAEHRVRAHAQLPQRGGELLLSRAQRPGDGRPGLRPGEHVSHVEVPPAGPVGDRVQAAVVAPDRSQHRLGVAAHDQLLLALVADRPGATERRDPEFGAVPWHPGVIPADPGQPGAVR